MKNIFSSNNGSIGLGFQLLLGAVGGIIGAFLILYLIIQLGSPTTTIAPASKVIEDITKSSSNSANVERNESASQNNSPDLDRNTVAAVRFDSTKIAVAALLKLLESPNFTVNDLGDTIDELDREVKSLPSAVSEDDRTIIALVNLLQTAAHDWGRIVLTEEEAIPKLKSQIGETLASLKRNEKLIRSSPVLVESVGQQIPELEKKLSMIDRGYFPIGELATDEAKISHFTKDLGIDVEKEAGFGWVKCDSTRKILRAKCVALSKGFLLAIEKQGSRQ